VARSIALMGLRHAVITSVTRDDLPDGGAAHWARVVEAVRCAAPETTIEVLIPDFGGDTSLVDVVLAARPDIVGHNIETVERLTPSIRSRAEYRTSLAVLRHIAGSGAVAKSGLMVGLGETRDEVLAALDDLRAAGVSVVTIGQYLRPTLQHAPVAEYVTPSTFEFYKQEALARGFSYVASGPLVRSSYLAEQALPSLKGPADGCGGRSADGGF
jgi:lipoic acid synthetase